MSDNELVPITEPIVVWAGVQLDPTHYSSKNYWITPPHGNHPAYLTCAPHCGAWTLPMAWREGSYWLYWDGGRYGPPTVDWHMPVQLYRDLGEVRRRKEQIRSEIAKQMAQVSGMCQLLGEPTLDLEAIKQRHLSGDVQRTLYDGHVLVDLALVIEELERYRAAPSVLEIKQDPDQEHDDIPF